MKFVNTSLLTSRNIMVIGIVTIIVHMFLGPLYARIGTLGQGSTDTQS